MEDVKTVDDGQEEELVWRRGGSDSLLIRSLDDMTELLAHVAKIEVKNAEKQLKELKKF